MRVIEPPPSELSRLRTPLTAGEREVLNLLHAWLAPEWEFYLQPHLNGLRPDLVLLNPHVGIAVFEIKDWDLGAMRYFTKKGDHGVELWAQASGQPPHRMEAKNPVRQIMAYQEEVAQLYCPRLVGDKGIAVISAGLIFTRSTSAQVNALLGPFRKQIDAIGKHPQYFPLAGSDDLATSQLDRIFPEHSRKSSYHMNAEIAADLRNWLREPDHSREQRQRIELDTQQRGYAESRTDTGFRRIKGPAGAGKSLVLAARAARLAAAGKRVLVVTFNITLKNYLRDLAIRETDTPRASFNQIDFLNYHYWCKRVCNSGGHAAAYKALWRGSDPEDGSGRASQASKDVLDEQLAALAAKVLDEDKDQLVQRYDAILVDEGQDFRLSWWNSLRKALVPGGEMLLVADKTQDIYGTASAWTEDAMTGSGFSGGRWAELKVSYRLPQPLIPLVCKFAADFMQKVEVDRPIERPGAAQLDFGDQRTRLRWVQVGSTHELPDTVANEVSTMMERLTPTSSVSDIVILLPDQYVGKKVVESLEQKLTIRMTHTFDEDSRKARKLKLAFFKGSARIKATTLHSFKGWESRHLLVVVKDLKDAESQALLYTAMTRLKHDAGGCALTVVSGSADLRSFGATWPEHVGC